MTKKLIITVFILSGLFVGSMTALAKNATSTAGFNAKDREIKNATSTAKLNAKKTVDIACVKTAVEKRETAIQASLDKFTTAVKTALTARKTALLAAWDITDLKQRAAAIKTAWNTYKKAEQSARKAFRTERNAIWKQFSTDRQACKATPTGENLGEDLSL
ncbi:MAG: hypothetical protein A2550_01880 [Candidatus Jacksonbacteria bacterium RIFOXYD2_FULL_43_21]|nr:MAG: hypothetical protein A2550_01880 [Candidatus Jacksonbacteria bacterium RIFOXYD2_FULL_43_21]HCR15267.1 hypothetical protein [Candidatus Jacksonbacteria bacterium]